MSRKQVMLTLLVAASSVAWLAAPQALAGSHPETVKLQKGGGDPHGPDPRGPDPRNEVHDPNLPANKEREQGKAPRDVYGGQVPNDRRPY
ncbi:MAG: hypothetical protein K2Y32_22540 [Candidatus Obscuribacterales bacterium]|nr:hypothetical protein [Candidatus Obscuribacterales bacterium]